VFSVILLLNPVIHRLDHVKSMEIVFVSQRCKRAVVIIPQPLIISLRFQPSQKSWKLGLWAWQSAGNYLWHSTSTILLYRVRSRWVHCTHFGTMALPTDGLHTVFQATVVAKLSYASPAWWGLTWAPDHDRLEAVLRWSTALGFRPPTVPTLDTVERLTSDCSWLSHSTRLIFIVSCPQTWHALLVEALCSRLQSFNSNNLTYLQ